MARTATNKVKAPEVAPDRIGRRERNKLEKRSRIVAAARRLFAEQGFAETTTQQIAESADIGTGTLFLYARWLCCKHGARPRGVTQLGD